MVSWLQCYFVCYRCCFVAKYIFFNPHNNHFKHICICKSLYKTKNKWKKNRENICNGVDRYAVDFFYVCHYVFFYCEYMYFKYIVHNPDSCDKWYIFVQRYLKYFGMRTIKYFLNKCSHSSSIFYSVYHSVYILSLKLWRITKTYLF